MKSTITKNNKLSLIGSISLGTGLMMSYAAKLLYGNTTQKGLKHIEEICDFDELKTILEQHNIQILNQEGL